ncbi:unnamed protein product [Cuscuta epithymum]|uniref:Uncharacterized protein n=1 Tax=Cuscuta epithymum TaxID=186058 RepID=A0AAV0C7K6_9ASTE|nr:unnamed protein product [Cuscuta epithymum]CAH9084354.1 unnamed protein product [Cuscuta epithymum]
MVLDFDSWKGKPNDWQPKSVEAPHVVAVNTKLQPNEGLQVKYHGIKEPDSIQVTTLVSLFSARGMNPSFVLNSKYTWLGFQLKLNTSSYLDLCFFQGNPKPSMIPFLMICFIWI